MNGRAGMSQAPARPNLQPPKGFHPMSQATQRTTTFPSRRALLAGAPAVAAAALAAGTAANGLAMAVASPSGDDPILALIAKHRAAILAWSREIDAGNEDADDERDLRDDLHWEILNVQPTTLAGVAALLAHVGEPEFIKEPRPGCEDGRETVLSILIHGEGEWKRASQDFPLRLAETVRKLIGEARSL
jgi:hypothetical protein